MFHLFDKAILGMSILRLLSGTIEIIVALVILKLNHVEKALMINSMLAIVGPIILILTTSIGLIGLADKISLTKIFWIVIGICFILYGVNSK
ncbi:YqhV family protein [Caldibacillus thermolactis]|mgnify:CR=1 FL=1|jgi:putative exporter of polyketide antibiotics|uniref:YqhV family protein n=1 Tax=Pallidibacillus thermolactis TaxID=251051 RepID=A0ABT2WDY8_9BACI|nr:YqhV family protein [Pallidibacillus thermolactis]MCU9593009.1 YqhV family protein [Pallidibacillus thermolactis]MCU9600675.1 YqhV family protein [Pallidibacillus thermolactis subsp. kokeshiiformis]MED1674677.1 YqhV family protein [Pallidibacillus thermolactis subsp. kokeshiiformis]